MITPRWLLRGIFIVSLFGTVGSLYVWYFWDPFNNFLSGEIFNRANAVAACDLCRYIRIFQFPLLVISAIALLRNDFHSILYIRPLAFLGVIVSLYKYALEMWLLTEQWFCGINGGPSCSSSPIMYRGFITLAFLGVVSFSLILLFSRLIKKHISSHQSM